MLLVVTIDKQTNVLLSIFLSCVLPCFLSSLSFALFFFRVFLHRKRAIFFEGYRGFPARDQWFLSCKHSPFNAAVMGWKKEKAWEKAKGHNGTLMMLYDCLSASCLFACFFQLTLSFPSSDGFLSPVPFPLTVTSRDKIVFRVFTLVYVCISNDYHRHTT